MAMWKSDKSTQQNPDAVPAVERPVTGSEPAPGRELPRTPAAPVAAGSSLQETGGRTVAIRGELKASEDLIVEGQIEGRVELAQNVLTVGATARLKAEIVARAVIVDGEVVGNITATERVEIRSSHGSVEGDIKTPRIAIADGARVLGRIDMAKPAGGARPAEAAGRKPEASAAALGP